MYETYSYLSFGPILGMKVRDAEWRSLLALGDGEVPQIDLLVLFTHEVESALGESGMLARIDTDIENFQISIINSLLDSEVHFDFIGPEMIDEYPEEEGNGPLQSTEVHLDQAYLSQDIDDLVTTTGADLVLLYVKHFSLGAAGTSSLDNFGSSSEGYISILDSYSDPANFTFAHEIMHNLGCQHETGTPPARAADVIGRTVLHVGEPGNNVSSRILSYSSDDPLVGTGNIDRDNAGQINGNIACTVGSFRGTYFNASIRISGPLYANNGYFINAEANTICDQGNILITFPLEYSLDGTSFVVVPSQYLNGDHLLVNFPMPLNRHLYLRARSKCNGVSLVDVHQVRNSDFDYPDPCDLQALHGGLDSDEHGISISCFPNPGFGLIDINLIMPNTGLANLLISDINGKHILKRSNVLKRGNSKIQLDLNSINEGTYIISIEDSHGEKAFTKLLILK